MNSSSRLPVRILIAAVLLGVLGGCFFYVAFMHASRALVAQAPTAGGIQYEIVTTQAAQERGLGGRTEIPHHYGMLFPFTTPGTYGFWMKDMRTSIDMLWLAHDGTIVKIDDSVATSTYPQIFYPPTPVWYVLETRAGEARALGWNVGTRVPLPAP